LRTEIFGFLIEIFLELCCAHRSHKTIVNAVLNRNSIQPARRLHTHHYRVPLSGLDDPV
jgi:hypothetical protein